jgi:hypothetical protein
MKKKREEKGYGGDDEVEEEEEEVDSVLRRFHWLRSSSGEAVTR